MIRERVSFVRIGDKLRRLRLQRGMTQQELASRCELTTGFVSQLEHNLATPSLPTLMDIVEALGSDMATFFSEKAEQKIVFGKDDFFEDDRENCSIAWIVPNAQKNAMEPIIVTLKPHQASWVMEPHKGEEFGLVLSGSISLVNGGRKHRVRKGETFYIQGDQEHFLKNDAASEARILWITTPPLF